MSSQYSRRNFLKDSALAAGVLALGGLQPANALASSTEKPKVFFTRDISSDAILQLYSLINSNISGKVAIKLHTGEPHGPNILPREWAQKFQAAIPNSTIVECNVLYDSPRKTTEGHRETLKINGWTFSKVDIMDEDGDTPLPIPAANG